MILLKIKHIDAGGRLDKYLLKFLKDAPASFIYKMLRKKNIVLNGKKAAGNEFLKENHQRTETDCGQWDLNPYALRHRNLNPARLPIPP